MRALLLFLPLLVGCAHRHPAETFVKHGFSFAGPRVVSLRGNAGDVERLGAHLRAVGFKVDDSTARYSLNVEGICYAEGIKSYAQTTVSEYTGGWAPEELKVEAFRLSDGERVFAAHLDDNADCPEAFLRATASALARNWPDSR